MTISSILHSLKTDTKLSFQFYQAVRFGMIVLTSIILVKFGFSQEEMSAFEWVFFISNAVSFFWASGLLTGFLSYATSISEINRPSFIKSLMAFFFIGAIITASLLYLGEVLGVYNLGRFSLQTALYLLFNVSSSIIVITFLIQGKASKIFYYGIISYVLYTIIIVSCYFIEKNNMEVVVNGLVMWSFLQFLYFIYCYLKEQGSMQFKILVPFFIFSIPLILKTVLGQGMPYIDGFLVTSFFEDHYFAIYRYGARELPFITILITALVNSTIPLAVNNLSSSMDDIKERMRKLMHWLFPISIVLMFLSDYLFAFFYSEEYLLSAKIFNLYLLLICSRFLVPQLSLFALHKNKELLIIAVIEAGTNIFLSIILLKQFGILGIVYATLIAFLLQKLIMIILNHVKYGIPLRSYLSVNTYIIYSGLLFTAFLANEFFL